MPMILVQVASAKFDSGSARLAVRFASPTLAGSILAVAFIATEAVPRVDDDTSGFRWWRMAADIAASPSRGGCRQDNWARSHTAPAGVIEIVGETARGVGETTGRPATGRAIAVEVQGARQEQALEALNELLLGIKPEPHESSIL